MVDALRDEISADMDRADDIQNEFFDSVEETLARMEDRIQASEQEVGEIEQVLRGEMADWISRQMAEVRLAQVRSRGAPKQWCQARSCRGAKSPAGAFVDCHPKAQC